MGAQEIIIVHSKTDRILPIEAARMTHKALHPSQLIELEDLGHYSILWSEELHQIINKKFKKQSNN